jgi:hypothetical protein
MRIGLAVACSVIFHAGSSWALLELVLRTDPPEPWWPNGIACVFPEAPPDYRALFIGLRPAEVARVLGRETTTELASAASCVRYRYPSGSEISVFFSRGVATKVIFGSSPPGRACNETAVMLASVS